MRISDPMAPKTGSVRISRDTRFSFFGDPKEYGASRMYKLYCITITSSIIVRVVNSNYKRREETYFNRVLRRIQATLYIFSFVHPPRYIYIYIRTESLLFLIDRYIRPFRKLVLFPPSLVSLFVNECYTVLKMEVRRGSIEEGGRGRKKVARGWRKGRSFLEIRRRSFFFSCLGKHGRKLQMFTPRSDPLLISARLPRN